MEFLTTGPIPVRELYIVHEKLSRAGQMRKRFWPRWQDGCTIEAPATCLGDSKYGSLDEQRTEFRQVYRPTGRQRELEVLVGVVRTGKRHSTFTRGGETRPHGGIKSFTVDMVRWWDATAIPPCP
jgi:hypothetical protein